MYLDCFKIPIDKEEAMLKKRMIQNGGPKHGYIDNSYPCGLFFYKQFHEVNFDRITIFYGGNGSGKSTLLNLIAQKLKLNRVAPYNSGEMFDLYVEEFCMAAAKKGVSSRVFPMAARHWSGGSVAPRYTTQEAYVNAKYPLDCFTGTSSWVLGGTPPFFRRLTVAVKRTLRRLC